MRRSVWEQIPFPEIAFGEDQAWASQVLCAGYEKLYVDQAIVYHSHDYDEKQTEERAFTEAQYHLKHFGYLLISSARAEQRLRDMNSRDIKYAKNHGIEAAEVERRLKLNASKVAGYVKANSLNEN